MDSPAVRRSGRKRTQKRYSLDTFEGMDIDSDVAASSEEDAVSKRKRKNEDQDQEFGAADAEAIEQSLDEDEEDGDLADEVRTDDGEGSEPEGSLAFGDVEDGMLEDGRGLRTSDPTASKGKRRPPKKPTKSAKEVPAYEAFDSATYSSHTSRPTHRPYFASESAQEGQVKSAFGIEAEDVIPVLQYRDRWRAVKNLPTKLQNQGNEGGLHEAFWTASNQYKRDFQSSWDWFQKFGQESFKEAQVFRSLTRNQGLAYIRPCSPKAIRYLRGPYGNQRLQTLEAFEAVSTSQSWTGDTAAAVSTEQRRGWILNPGSGKVSVCEWAPNCLGKCQYLALCAIEIRKNEKPPRNMIHKPPKSVDAQEELNPHDKIYNAFEASDVTSDAIQIWAISNTSTEIATNSVDVSQRPHLVRVFCTKWGTIRHLKWCPVPLPSYQDNDEGAVSLGLLAIISGDGNLRVLDVIVPSQAGDSTEWSYIEKVAFCSRPSQTTATCVTWLSSSIIGVGCSSGSVALYDISELLTPAGQPSGKMSPFFIHPLHQTYILSIVCGYPSRPHLLFTSSMDGFTRVTDINAPYTETLFGPRSRFAPNCLEWSEALQGVYHSLDDQIVRIGQWRRFGVTMGMAKLTAQSTCIAVGTAHPHLLLGATDGTVVVINPLRKYWMRRNPIVQLTWFWHEWSGKNDFEKGVCRMVEGFRAEKKLEKQPTEFKMGILPGTLYDEESAISAVAWNPNVHCGGWAAVGMASGLVRIEDLAV